MTTMEQKAEKYAEGVATALVGKLGQLITQEYLLLSGVRGNVVHLRDDVAIMNALLRMLSETDDGAVSHFVREWMKQVRELNYDAEDCIDLFVKRISWAGRAAGYFGFTCHLIATLYPRHCLAGDIKALRARATAIRDRRAQYGIGSQELPPSIAFGSRYPVVGVANADDDPAQFYVDTENRIQTVSDRVTATQQANGVLEVHSIVGLGGVGKTTLAERVLDKLEATFQCRAVVSVSQKFDPDRDMDGLLRHINKKFSKPDDVTLQVHLNQKRYLIVLDDVWTISAFNAIRAKLPDNNMHNIIIVTTRSDTVATTCSSQPDYIFHANILSPDDSRSIFVKRVFGQRVPPHEPPPVPVQEPPPVHQQELQQVPTQEPPPVPAQVPPPVHQQELQQVPPEEPPQVPQQVPEELQEKMDIILRKCGGLPLAIVSIARILVRYNLPSSLEMWTRVWNSIGSQLETNTTLEGMMQIIALSYNFLPHHLKECTMLLSIFPEDYMIPKARILRRWISEGLIPEKRRLTLQEVAEAYYDELLSRNVIQPGVDSNGAVSQKHCRVHDFMLEVIVSKSLEANFVSLVGGAHGGTSSYDNVRRLSIHGDVGHVAEGRSMQHVRSLTSFGLKKNNGLGKLLDQLAKFTLLKVLDLEDCQDLTNQHLEQVCRLFLLRYLNLNGTNITKIPDKISNLQHLQTLTLYDTFLDSFPPSVVNLEKLEHMTFGREADDDTIIFLGLPEGINKMKSLQLLHGLAVGSNDIKLAGEIVELVNLRNLSHKILQDCDQSVSRKFESSIDTLRSFSLRYVAEN